MNLKRILYRLVALSILLQFGSIAIGQNEIESGILVEYLKETLDEMQGDIEDRPEFKITEVPKAWEDESAVVLFRYVHYQAFKEKEQEHVRIYSKYRVKLQDQWALNDYSEYYFGHDDLVFIKIIKPNGDRYDVDMDDAVLVTTKVEDNVGLSSYSVNVDAYNKIALPNLEQGDIVEVVQVSENVYWNRFLGVRHYKYPSNLKTLMLGKGTPVYHNFIKFDIESPFRLNFKSINGAPEIQEEKLRTDKAEYLFHDTLRSRNKGEFWSGGVGYNPSVKFVLSKYYSKTEKVDFSKKSMDVMQGVEENDLIDYAHNVATNKEKSHSGVYRDFIKQFKGPSIAEDDDYIRNFFFYYRTRAFMKKKNRNFANVAFVRDFSRILNKRKIGYEYIVAVPRTLGGLSNLISMDEMIWAIRLKSNGAIYSAFDAYATPGEMSRHFYGHDIYTIIPDRKKGRMSLTKDSFPVPEPKKNLLAYDMEVSFDKNMEQVVVKRKIEASGEQKQRLNAFIPSSRLFSKDYERDGIKSTAFTLPKEFYYMEMGNDPDRMDEEHERLKKVFNQADISYMKSRVKKDLNGDGMKVKEVKQVEVVNDGRQEMDATMIVEDESIVENLIIKNGSYYILDLGKLIGGQFEIRDSEDKTRIEPIYFGYTREYAYQIKITLPEGFSVSGLERFNRKVDNEAGAFEISAKVKDGILTIESSKKYKGIEFPKEKWDAVNAFIHAASDVNQSKIILSR